MKNFKNAIIAITLLLVASVAIVSCEKEGFNASPISNAQDVFSNEEENGTVSDESFDMQEDEIGYEPEAVTVTLSGGTLATDADADGACSAVKELHKKSIKVNTSKATLSLVFSENVSIDAITNENTKTGTGTVTGTNVAGQRLSFSEVTMGSDSMHWSAKINAGSDTFRIGSAKMEIKYKTKNTKNVMTDKKKSLTVYCIGSTPSGKLFGTQRWGYDFEGGDASKYTATPTAIDTATGSRWVPALNDVIVFGGASGTQRGIINSTPEVTAAGTTASGIKKGAKYVFTYVIWNPSCTATRKVGKATTYGGVFPTAKAKSDGGLLTGYVR